MDTNLLDILARASEEEYERNNIHPLEVVPSIVLYNQHILNFVDQWNGLYNQSLYNSIAGLHGCITTSAPNTFYLPSEYFNIDEIGHNRRKSTPLLLLLSAHVQHLGNHLMNTVDGMVSCTHHLSCYGTGKLRKGAYSYFMGKLIINTTSYNKIYLCSFWCSVKTNQSDGKIKFKIDTGKAHIMNTVENNEV